MIEFRADGTARQISAAMGDASWELRDDWLLTYWKDRATGKVSVLANRVELEGDELLQKDEQGNLVSRMRRAGPPGTTPTLTTSGSRSVTPAAVPGPVGNAAWVGSTP